MLSTRDAGHGGHSSTTTAPDMQRRARISTGLFGYYDIGSERVAAQEIVRCLKSC